MFVACEICAMCHSWSSWQFPVDLHVFGRYEPELIQTQKYQCGPPRSHFIKNCLIVSEMDVDKRIDRQKDPGSLCVSASRLRNTEAIYFSCKPRNFKCIQFYRSPYLKKVLISKFINWHCQLHKLLKRK